MGSYQLGVIPCRAFIIWCLEQQRRTIWLNLSNALLWGPVNKTELLNLSWWYFAFLPRHGSACECPDHQYTNKERDGCLQKAVTFLANKDSLGMALACMALCCSVLTAVVLGVFVKHWYTPIVKANNRTLSYLLLISLALCFLCSLLFIGHPNTAPCVLYQVAFRIVFTVAVSTILAKAITVVVAFKFTAPGRRMGQWLVSGKLTSSSHLLLYPTESLRTVARNLSCRHWHRGTFWTWSHHHCVQQGLGQCLLLCPGLPGPGELPLALPGPEPAWHLQWSQVHDIQHAGVLQCLRHLPPHLPQPQGQGHSGPGDLLHLGLHCGAIMLQLCSKVLFLLLLLRPDRNTLTS